MNDNINADSYDSDETKKELDFQAILVGNGKNILVVESTPTPLSEILVKQNCKVKKVIPKHDNPLDDVYEKFDVIVFVEDFIKSLPHNNIKIDFKSNNAPAYIVANKNKLAQVFYNIIHNSFSYSPSKSKILINTIIQDENIIFHIVDQGIGVPLDFKEKIFDRFYTDRLKDKDKHTGLGLSISRKIIESFKGSINLIENNYEIYQGACFEIKLPLKG